MLTRKGEGNIRIRLELFFNLFDVDVILFLFPEKKHACHESKQLRRAVYGMYTVSFTGSEAKERENIEK